MLFLLTVDSRHRDVGAKALPNTRDGASLLPGTVYVKCDPPLTATRFDV